VFSVLFGKNKHLFEFMRFYMGFSEIGTRANKKTHNIKMI